MKNADEYIKELIDKYLKGERWTRLSFVKE